MFLLMDCSKEVKHYKVNIQSKRNVNNGHYATNKGEVESVEKLTGNIDGKENVDSGQDATSNGEARKVEKDDDYEDNSDLNSYNVNDKYDEASIGESEYGEVNNFKKVVNDNVRFLKREQ